MPKVVFTPNLSRHLECPPLDVDGTSVRSALDEVFADNPRLRGYILDDQGRVRHHVAIFVDGGMVSDRDELTDTVGAASEIYVMQALSGG